MAEAAVVQAQNLPRHHPTPNSCLTTLLPRCLVRRFRDWCADQVVSEYFDITDVLLSGVVDTSVSQP